MNIEAYVYKQFRPHTKPHTYTLTHTYTNTHILTQLHRSSANAKSHTQTLINIYKHTHTRIYRPICTHVSEYKCMCICMFKLNV